MARLDPNYLQQRSEDQLRNELRFELERILALREAFMELPDVAPVEALHLLSEFATYPRDWERGKKMQAAGLNVPPNSECESGAGLWALIRDALRDSQ